MEIKYKDYFLVQDGNHFDLHKEIEKTKKDTGETYTSRKELGYGYSLLSAINRIVNEELASKNITVDLKEYLELFKQEKEELKLLLTQHEL